MTDEKDATPRRNIDEALITRRMSKMLSGHEQVLGKALESLQEDNPLRKFRDHGFQIVAELVELSEEDIQKLNDPKIDIDRVKKEFEDNSLPFDARTKAIKYLQNKSDQQFKETELRAEYARKFGIKL
jgi:hypothetical protein